MYSKRKYTVRDPFSFSLGGMHVIAPAFPPIAVADDQFRRDPSRDNRQEQPESAVNPSAWSQPEQQPA